MIRTITINGYTMGEGTNITILNASGFGSPRVDSALYPNSGRHGSQLVNAFWRERRIALEFGLRATTIANYATLREAFLKAWSLPRTGIKAMEFTTTDGKNLTLNVQLLNVIDAPYEKGNLTVGKAMVELVAPSPYINDQTINTSTVYLPVAGGTTIPTAIPLSLTSSGGVVTITNGGNGIFKPTITIYGACIDPTISNSLTGELFQIDGTFTASDEIVVDCENETVTLNGVTNILDDFTGDFLSLNPGNNPISFSSGSYDANTYAEIEWQQSWLGV